MAGSPLPVIFSWDQPELVFSFGGTLSWGHPTSVLQLGVSVVITLHYSQFSNGVRPKLVVVVGIAVSRDFQLGSP